MRSHLATAPTRIVPLLLVSLAFPAEAQGPPEPPSGFPVTPAPFQVIEVADGIYAAVVDPAVPSYAFANSLIVIGAAGVLVVDTQQHPDATRALISEIRARTHLPVRWVVNTHWHGDHTWGNVAYAEAFPGVRFLAHPATRDSLVHGWERQAEQQREHTRRSLERIDSMLELEGDPDRIRRLEEARAVRNGYLEMLAGLAVVPPEGSITASTEIDAGGRLVRLIPAGPGHTPGDVVVHVPDVALVAVGDLLEEGGPWLDGANLDGWIRALRAIESLRPRLLLPSHGGLKRDLDLLRAHLRDLEEARSSAEIGGRSDG